jgi:hypothetical protein
VVYPRLPAFVTDYRAPLYHRGPRMERNFRLEAQVSGTTEVDAERAFVARAAIGRMVKEHEVADSVVAMLRKPGCPAPTSTSLCRNDRLDAR